ncbi:MAG: hydrogenase nickel incorporation protein HypB [Deltaproteobacteria bacterium]|nr:hydrogenase nickel incorporation protein HypB [Deltaproteobacteria bacterium]
MVEIAVERRVLEANDRLAADNRRLLEKKGVFVVNIMSSPGAGKTTLLERTAAGLKGEFNLAVIEGDIQTTTDADRIAAQGVAAVQINTAGACHLDAQMVGQALDALELDGLDLLIIENVGNLVCPAGFDLGERARVMLLSTPEGEDKPAKYPLMFRLCQVLIINKTDLLPYLPFSLEAVKREVARINPQMEIFELSALKDQGLEAWLDWLRAGVAEMRAGG